MTMYRQTGITLSMAVVLFALGPGCASCSKSGKRERTGPSTGPIAIFGSVRVRGEKVDLYADYGRDSAVLGLTVPDKAGSPRYFPVYASTHGGLPSVTLDVFVSDAGNEMWLRSSWRGYDVLAYYDANSDRCITRYGENTAFAAPTPSSLTGGQGSFPQMNPARVRRALRYTHSAP